MEYVMLVGLLNMDTYDKQRPGKWNQKKVRDFQAVTHLGREGCVYSGNLREERRNFRIQETTRR